MMMAESARVKDAAARPPAKAMPNKRFRDRQKETLCTLEQTVREKQEEYQRVLQENDDVSDAYFYELLLYMPKKP